MLDAIIPLLSLIALEVILGIDNIIFISILADKLPEKERPRLRFWGIGLAMVLRLILLGFISWILKLDTTLFSLYETNFTGKGIILILGGLFLIYKSTKEIYHKTEAINQTETIKPKNLSFKKLLGEVIILDLVFSVDSIITAVGMVNELWVMYAAVIITVLIMLVAAKPISEFISKHPSFKVLALCFLMMIGVSLLAEGFEFEIPKGYIYFSMAFAFLVDVIQMRTIKTEQKTLNMTTLLNNFKISINDKLYVKDPETSELGKKIIQNSIYLIDEIGFESFTFKKLGERIQSNESSIYRYFENKHKLLVYLSTWYWSWFEYNLVFSTNNIANPSEKLSLGIKIITQNIEDDKNTPHIDEHILNKIIVSEFTKTLLTKEVDAENKEGFFLVYKRIIYRIIEMIENVNPEYPYAKSLASSIVEGTLHQNYLKNHFKTITNLSDKDCITDFYLDMIKKIV
jgi:predicted tellurium resistance membrane protein TerC/AcrR family transcriptional regulator